MIFVKCKKWFLLLLFVCIISDPVRSAIPQATTHRPKGQVQCTASLSPQNVIAKQFEANSTVSIRCNARISHESFTYPVFDLSFGLSPLTGIYILRGSKQCSPNNAHCWSEFKIPTLALRQLMISSVDTIAATTTTGKDASADEKVTHHHSVIDFTCNVADSSRNSSLAVRCSDSGTVRFAKVLKYGEKCSTVPDVVEECRQNMHCVAGRCVCKQGFLPYQLSPREEICVEKAALGEKCNFTRQCSQKVAESLCEFDASLGFKICKCLSGFEETESTSANQLYCAPMKFTTEAVVRAKTTPTPSPSPVNGFDIYEKKDTKPQESEVYILNTTVQRELETETVDGDNSLWMLPQTARTEPIGLILFAGVLLMAILLVIIIIRVRNHGKMKISKESMNGKTKSIKHTHSDPLLGAINRLSDDDEVDMHIEDTEETNNGGKLIYQPSDTVDHDHDDVNGQLSFSEPTSPSNDELSRAESAQSGSNHSLTTFNYSAKQSTV